MLTQCMQLYTDKYIPTVRDGEDCVNDCFKKKKKFLLAGHNCSHTPSGGVVSISGVTQGDFMHHGSKDSLHVAMQCITFYYSLRVAMQCITF